MDESDNNQGDSCTENEILLTDSNSSEDLDSWTLLGKNYNPMYLEPSGVQIITGKSADLEEDLLRRNADYERKQQNLSLRSTNTPLNDSSDGINVISDNDVINSDKQQIEKELQEAPESFLLTKPKIDLLVPDYEPPTPPFTPDDLNSHVKEKDENNELQHLTRLEDDSIDNIRSIVGHRRAISLPDKNWIIFSVLGTGMLAIILGNTLRLQNLKEDINFEHEKRISELELENNILKKEMNKLRHLYTRSELDEQVRMADLEWMNLLQQQVKEEAFTDFQPPNSDLISDPASDSIPHKRTRTVVPQDVGVKRKVVWSGDEEEPMILADKEYVLPAFCYNQNHAVQNDLFFEYIAKYCDIKKRKIDTKQRKAELNHKYQERKENYVKYLKPKLSEQSEEFHLEHGKPASPFNIDYQKAFDTIKAEGNVILESFGGIWDLSPEPEENFKSKISADSLEDTEKGDAITIPEIIPDRHHDFQKDYMKTAEKLHQPQKQDADQQNYSFRKAEKHLHDNNRNNNKGQKTHFRKEKYKFDDRNENDNRFVQKNDHKHQEHHGGNFNRGKRESVTCDSMEVEKYNAQIEGRNENKKLRINVVGDSSKSDRGGTMQNNDFTKHYDSYDDTANKQHFFKHDENGRPNEKFEPFGNNNVHKHDQRKEEDRPPQVMEDIDKKYSYLEHYKRGYEKSNKQKEHSHEYKKKYKKYNENQKLNEKRYKSSKEAHHHKHRGSVERH